MVAIDPTVPIYFSDLPQVLGGNVIQYTHNQPIDQLLLDSRQRTLTPNSLFFAIKGKNHDSHQFIPNLYAQGIRQFIVEQPASTSHLPDANILAVKASITALQTLATFHRNRYALPLLAITGSSGKTMIKEWLSQLLALQYPIIQSPQSYNSQIGVPLSVWELNTTHAYGIFEAGISLPGEMAKLATILKPTLGLFTNIGSAHEAGFTTQKQKIQEKAQLFASCKKIYYSADHTAVADVLQLLYSNTCQLVSWSWNPTKANYQVQAYKGPDSTDTLLHLTHQQQQYTFTVPFRDPVSIENSIHCIVFLLHEGLMSQPIAAALPTLRSTPIHLMVKPGIQHCQLIDDTYHNDWVGLKAALSFLEQQESIAKRTVIVADLVQKGVPAEQLYSQVAALFQEKKITRVLGVGPMITAQAAAFSAFSTHFYKHTEALLQDFPTFSHEVILIKGTRDNSFDRVVTQLQQKLHSTALTVNLGAITYNLNFFRSKLQKNTKLMAIVKACAYGSSHFEVASLLQYQRVDYLAVAYTDEGVTLRKQGITLPIMVMNPTPEHIDTLVDYQLEPTVYNLRLLRILAAYRTHTHYTMPIHLKLETGLYRLGLAADELDTVVQLLRATPWIKVASILSHLAASEAPHHDSYTHYQAAIFLQQAQYIEKQLAYTTTKHLLNSAGIVRFPQYQFDMVRLGIGLYGVGMPAVIQRQTEVAITLKTVISQIKTVPPGCTIGYGRRGAAAHTRQMATLAIGYADGLNRAMGNGTGTVWIQGHEAPFVGHICMDMCMVDVTGLPVAEGDEVIIFGKERNIDTLANAIGTIAYELLTNVGDRVKRIYYTQ